MMIKVDWEKLKQVHQNLIKQEELNDNTDIIFIMITKDGKAKKSIIKFKDFMSFFWLLSENKEFSILTLVIQDKTGRILYRHKQYNTSNEEIPDGGNGVIVQNWNNLTEQNKELFMRLMISQIEGYEK